MRFLVRTSLVTAGLCALSLFGQSFREVAARAYAHAGAPLARYHLRSTHTLQEPREPTRTLSFEEWVDGTRFRLNRRVKIHHWLAQDVTVHHVFDGQQHWASRFRRRPLPMEKTRGLETPFFPLLSKAFWERLRTTEGESVPEALEGQASLRLDLPVVNGRRVSLWVEAASCLPQRVTVTQDGKLRWDQRFRDHRAVEGRLLPHRVETRALDASGAATTRVAVVHAMDVAPVDPQHFKVEPRIPPQAHPEWTCPDPGLPARLEGDVRRLVEGFPNRDVGHPEVLDQVATHLGSLLKDSGGRVTEQVFEYKGRNHRNVLASFGPTQGPRIVVGAHYDAVEGQPGADDNASALAVLLELARRFHENPPPITVELAAYTLEEQGMVGSEHHARALRAAGTQVTAMISLEMLGFYRDEPDSQEVPLSLMRWLYPTKGNFLAVVGRREGIAARLRKAMEGANPLPLESVQVPVRWMPEIGRSDHASFWREGYPAVMITDTADFRNHAYHTLDDTPDRLDYRRMAMAALAVEKGVRGLGASGR